MNRIAVATMSTSITLMAVLGVEGPRAGRTTFPADPPWPPWFVYAAPLHRAVVSHFVDGGGAGRAGLAMGLAAVRRGWRPRPGRVIASSVVAVIALMRVPPVDNGDPLYYAAYGRIAVLGHNPYVRTPIEQIPSTDPVRVGVPFRRQDPPSRYGPVATVTEAAASKLGGTSVARTVFWLKVWNALAFLTLGYWYWTGQCVQMRAAGCGHICCGR